MLAQIDIDAIHALSHAIDALRVQINALVEKDTRVDEVTAALTVNDVATAKLIVGVK